MRIAVVFTILLVVLLPTMALMMTGDGTTKGRLQSFVSYGLSLTAFLLCLLTIVVSIYTVTSDFDKRQIYTVLTKPIRRFQLLLGKLLGVLLLDTALLIFFSLIIYSITCYIPRHYHASDGERAMLDNEFYTARVGVRPPEVDVSRDVLKTYDRLEKTGQLPPSVLEHKVSRESYKKALAERIKLGKRAVEPGRDLVWKFYDVNPLGPDQSLFIRFKYNVSVNPPDMAIFGQWFAGDNREPPPVGETFSRKDQIRTFNEIQVPASVAAEDGYLAVGFFNDPRFNNTVVIFPPEDGLEVLYKADSFTANFIRAVALIFFRLIFLACLGIFASTFLSFPVAVLLCLVIFFTATISSFVIDSINALSEDISGIYHFTVKPVIKLLPQFDKFNPTNFLVPARLLSWSLLAKVGGFMVCVKAFMLMTAALLIFSFREIAKIII